MEYERGGFFLYLFILLSITRLVHPVKAANASTVSFKVGVVLDSGSFVGKTSLTCIKMAVSDFYAGHPDYSTRIVLHNRDSGGDVIGAASAALELLKNEQVQVIIGPQTPAEADFVSELGNKSQVPILSFTAASPSLSSKQTPYFVMTTVNESSQAKPIAAIVQAFGWKQVVPIYEGTDYGSSLIPYLADAFTAVGSRVPYRSVIPTGASDDYIMKELYKLMTMQTRVFVVHMAGSLGSRFFSNAKEAGMMEGGYVWIITDGLASVLGSIDLSSRLNSMQGLLGVKPFVPRTEAVRGFSKRWRREYLLENPDSDVIELSTHGLRAYDTVWAVAIAVESAGIRNPAGYVDTMATNSSTDLSEIGISKAGPKLLDSILKTEFDGLAGRFRIDNGQLHAPAFEIFNVIGEKERGIGFWTPAHGLSRYPKNSVGENSYSASKDNVGPIIWPGESMLIPKGWEEPTSGKKMRIGVPGHVEPGFHSFLQVERDPVTDATIVGGYVIEVFETALKNLPYAVRFEYVSFQKKDGTSAGNYDDLIYQVVLQNFDAVVGDITITANRSNFVDFTLPYTASGISMVVPLKEKMEKNAWIFLIPLSRDLWLVTGAFFVFTGTVVWVLEHRINEDFRGPPANHFGTAFYFIFSTLVFAHKEKIVSNMARVVVIIWVFVVLILTSSYTASLTTMLTVQQFFPAFTNIAELNRTGQYVGYLRNSFVREYLINWGFDQFKLRPFRSPQEYKDALSNGSIAAIVDEIPYLKVFLKSYCSDYTMSGPTHKTGGFGFVFPKGSSLVQDFSRAILNVTEGDQMPEIERKWFGDQTNCATQGSTSTNSSQSLHFASFGGLFLITGVVSLLALCIFLIFFLHQQRHLLCNRGTNSWLRFLAILREFDQRDLTSHTFGDESKVADPVRRSIGHDVPTSPRSNGSESPFSFSTQTHLGGTGTPPPEAASSNSGEEGTPPSELASPNPMIPAIS